MAIFAFAGDSIQLVPDASLILHVFVILVMVAILNRTLYRPINKVLEEREKETTGRRREAKELFGRIESGLSQYERELRQARAAGYQLLEQERTAALRQMEQRLGVLKEELKEQIAEEKLVIARQVQESRLSLNVETRVSAAEISSKILHRSG